MSGCRLPERPTRVFVVSFGFLRSPSWLPGVWMQDGHNLPGVFADFSFCFDRINIDAQQRGDFRQMPHYFLRMFGESVAQVYGLRAQELARRSVLVERVSRGFGNGH